MTKHTGFISTPSLIVDGVTVSSAIMAVEDWARIPDNPRQRRHELRLNKPHLRSLKPTHVNVAVAELPDGTRYKVDGHTRDELWRRGSLKKPDFLFLTIYNVPDISTVKELYDAYDSRNAVKQAADVMQGATREFDIPFRTKWLMEGKFSGFLNFAASRMKQAPATPFERVKFFRKELILLDEIEPSQSKFVIGIGAAALFFLRKHGKAAQSFLSDYNKGDGVRRGLLRDCVVFLEEFLAGERKAKSLAGHSRNASHCAFALGCMEASFDKKLRKRAPNVISVRDYVQSIS